MYNGLAIPSLLYQTRKKYPLVYKGLCISYTMPCPPVSGDNPQALASGLSYVQVDKHGITILYHLHQCRPYTSQDVTSESMCTNYWLTACSSLPRKKCG